MIHQFEDEVSAIQKALEEFDSGHRSNVVVLTEPFYGEDAGWIETAIGPGTKRIEGAYLADGHNLPDNAKVVIVEGLHRLYSRRIGGFGLIRSFMQSVASTEQLFIATCNAYSWRYLDQALRIGMLFPIQIDLPLLDASRLKEMLLSGYSVGELQFAGQSDPAGAIEDASLSFMGRRLVLSGRIQALRRALRPMPVSKTAEEIFFDRLARVSGGNPGIAKKLWAGALDYPRVREIPELPQALDLDQTEAFAMSLVLSAGRISKDELFSVLGQADEILYSLVKMQLVNLINGGKACEIRPEAVKPVAELLKRRRMAW